ncbi:MAG: hypothetical protein KDA31_04900 [Phycisphaerales bacterium]|nr:hypothetical protein [Phycisphaerales bacterium]MCB9836300.1 hypothetical protein [Phycisphaera sp.]
MEHNELRSWPGTKLEHTSRLASPREREVTRLLRRPRTRRRVRLAVGPVLLTVRFRYTRPALGVRGVRPR